MFSAHLHYSVILAFIYCLAAGPKWPRGLVCVSAAARLLGLWVRIQPKDVCVGLL